MEQASGQQMQDIKRLRLLSIPQASKSEQCDMPMDLTSTAALLPH